MSSAAAKSRLAGDGDDGALLRGLAGSCVVVGGVGFEVANLREAAETFTSPPGPFVT